MQLNVPSRVGGSEVILIKPYTLMTEEVLVSDVTVYWVSPEFNSAKPVFFGKLIPMALNDVSFWFILSEE